MKKNYTAGPWEARRSANKCGWSVYSSTTDTAITGWGRVVQSKANANLIAAAPDLLAACEEMVAEYEAGKNIQPYEIREMCRKAIAKARGEA